MRWWLFGLDTLDWVALVGGGALIGWFSPNILVAALGAAAWAAIWVKLLRHLLR